MEREDEREEECVRGREGRGSLSYHQKHNHNK